MSEFSPQAMVDEYKEKDHFQARDELYCPPGVHIRLYPSEVDEARELVGHALELSARSQVLLDGIHAETHQGQYVQWQMAPGVIASTFDSSDSEDGSRSRPLLIKDSSYSVDCGDIEYSEYGDDLTCEATLSSYGIRQARARRLWAPWTKRKPGTYSTDINFYAAGEPGSFAWPPAPLEKFKLRTAYYGYLANYLPQHTPEELGYGDDEVRRVGARVIKDEIEQFESALDFLEGRVEDQQNILGTSGEADIAKHATFYNFVMDPAPSPGNFK